MLDVLIHPTAVVSPEARLEEGVNIGPYVVIQGPVHIGKDTTIGPFCAVEGFTKIGQRCQIFTGAVIGSAPQDLKYGKEKTYLEIGDENIIREYVTMNPGTGDGGRTVVGKGNIFMAYSHVAHDCQVGNDCVIANSGTLAGHVVIEDRAVVGGLTAIHQFVRVGRLAIIGGCSKVVQDIPPFSTCDGHPAKVYSINSVGLKRAGFSPQIILALKKALRILFHEGHSLAHALKMVEKELGSITEVVYLTEFIRQSERGVCK